MADCELPLNISCDDCAVSMSTPPGVVSEICDDCIVTFLCGPDVRTGSAHDESVRFSRPQSVALSPAEARTVRLLQRADMAPRLRHTRHLDAVR